MKMLYSGLITSVRGYGNIAYGSAAETQFEKLVIQSTAVTLYVRAKKISATSSLQVEMEEILLQ